MVQNSDGNGNPELSPERIVVEFQIGESGNPTLKSIEPSGLMHKLLDSESAVITSGAQRIVFDTIHLNGTYEISQLAGSDTATLDEKYMPCRKINYHRMQ